jgi:cytochrome c553
MRNAIAHASPSEIAEAAGWFSRQPFVSRVKVIESASVPPTAPLGFILAAQPGPREPTAGRIIEVPDDPEAFELRDPRATFTAWVPPGSIARGRAIAAEMGCIECHAEQMNCWGPGRSPSYILRQLLAFKTRARHDVGAEPMQAVVDQLDMDQMVAVAAWLADGAKASP